MRKFLLLMIALLTGVSGAWAVDVKLATYNQPINTLVSASGTGTSTSLSSLAFSGLAGFTITAPNTDVTLGPNNADGYVNDTYGYCLSIVTPDANAHTVKLTAPSGYKIIGYSLFARSNTYSRNHTITPAAGGDAITSSTSGEWLKVSGILLAETSFTIQTGEGGNTCYIPRFTVSLVADSKKVKDKALTVGDAVTFSGIDAIADGTTPVLLYNNGRGTYVFDNPYTNHLGSCSASAGKVNTSAAKFLIKKSGDKYTIQNYDSKRYIPATSGNGGKDSEAALPKNAAQFTIIDNGNGTYGIKDAGNHSFNGNAAGYEGFCYWGSATTGNSAYKIMNISSEEDIEYTIPDAFYNTTGYYRIKVAGRGSWYMSASGSDTYMRLVTTAFDHSGAQVWKITSASNGVNLYSEGVDKYVTCNAHSAVGSSLNPFTNSSEAACNFIPEDKGSSNYGFLTYAPIKTYLSNNGGTGNGSMGYFTSYDEGGQLQLERVYRVTFNSDTGDFLQYLYSDGAVTTGDLPNYDFSIGGVAKTANEVVTAINAVSADDALTVVCARKRSATISTKAEIDPTKVYTLTVKRGKWLYASSNVKASFSNATIQTYNENNQWAFVTVDGGTTYYLYNVGKQRFVMSRHGSSNFLDSKYTVKPVTIEENGSDPSYPIRLKDGDLYFNENDGSLTISTHSFADDGNQFSIQAIDGVVFVPTEAQAAINAAASNVPFRVSPEPSGSFDQATYWYNVAMRPADGGYFAYVPADYFDSDPVNIPLNSTTGAKESTDNYRWCITGSATSGYRLFNKAAGPDKVFVFDGGEAGGGKMKAYSGNESASLFYLATANTPGNGSPTLVFPGTDYRPNKQGSPTRIASWSDSDTGSEFGFTFDEEYSGNNFFELYEEIVKPFMDAELSTKYFYLTSDKQKEAIWNAPERYSDGVEHTYYSHDDVTTMRTYVEAYVKKPTPTLGVRLKNNNTGKYVSYGAVTQGTGLICKETYPIAEADLTSVLQFIPTATPTTYYIYMPTKGMYVGSQTAGNTPFPLVEEASRAEFTITLTNTPGVISINDEASYASTYFQGYLHSAGWSIPGVVNWQAANLSSYWNIEDASVISLEMISPTAVDSGEDVYMSYANNLGLPLNAPEDATVYIITSQTAETAHLEEVDSKDIPAGSGVILKAQKGSTIEMNIKTSTEETLSGNILVAGDGSTTVGEGNFMLAYNSTDEIAKFYAIGASGFVVPANKAYLPSMGGEVKSLALSFDDVDGVSDVRGKMEDVRGEIFNLAGQKMSRLQKGLNIVNGKKVIVK